MLFESRVWRVAALAAVLVAIFSNPVVRRNLYRLTHSPGYDDSRLVTIDRDTLRFNNYGTVPPFVLPLWKKSEKFEQLLPFDRWTFADSTHAERVSPGILELTGIRPWRGRLLGADDRHAVVLSYEFAHGDPSLVGRELRIGFFKYTVIGIMPPGFRLVSRESQVWMLLPLFPSGFEIVGKLRPGVSLAEARDDLRRLAVVWPARRMELITLRHNRLDDLLFAVSILKWSFGFVCLMALGSLSRFLLRRRRNITLRQQLVYLRFLLARYSVLSVAMVLFWIVWVDPEVQRAVSEFAGWSVPVTFWAFLVAAWALAFRSLRDHQNRCRVCCERLRMPVASGTWSSLVLDRPRTEYICPYGHGTLYVPGTRLLDLDSVNWTSHQDMWRELFEQPAI